jgi:hypothetical protein
VVAVQALGVNGIRHCAFFYAFDLVWFIVLERRDLMVCSILSLFEDCSGLSCNMNMYQLAPIRCAPDQLSLATSIFSSRLVEFLVKYLDMPLAMTKIS